MQTLTLDQIKSDLKARLSQSRYAHTSSVVATVNFFVTILQAKYSELTTEYIEKLIIAAWLHDACKELKNQDQITAAEKYQIEIFAEDREFPNLLHSRVSAKWVEEEYGIKDPIILAAITDHTFGAVDMSLASKLLFLADMVEPLRDKKPSTRAFDHALMVNDFGGPLGKIRKIVIMDKDIDKALLEAMDSKLRYVLDKGQSLHPLGILARNSLLRKKL